tara:strand:+ start:8357 stop:8566 length:210 start_codon:yes stop_codon:yes gene_type:complete
MPDLFIKTSKPACRCWPARLAVLLAVTVFDRERFSMPLLVGKKDNVMITLKKIRRNGIVLYRVLEARSI